MELLAFQVPPVLRVQQALQVLRVLVEVEAVHRPLLERALAKEYFELELAIQTSPHPSVPELHVRVEVQSSISRPSAFLELIQLVLTLLAAVTIVDVAPGVCLPDSRRPNVVEVLLMGHVALLVLIKSQGLTHQPSLNF